MPETKEKSKSRRDDDLDDDGEGRGSKRAVLEDLAEERKKSRRLREELDELKERFDKLENGKEDPGKKDDDSVVDDRLKKLEEANAKLAADLEKSELTALKLEVGAAKGLTKAQSLRLSGKDREELEEDADDEDAFPRASTNGNGADDDDDAGSSGRSSLDRRPRENLKGGGRGDDRDDGPTDPMELVKDLPRI